MYIRYFWWAEADIPFITSSPIFKFSPLFQKWTKNGSSILIPSTPFIETITLIVLYITQILGSFSVHDFLLQIVLHIFKFFVQIFTLYIGKYIYIHQKRLYTSVLSKLLFSKQSPHMLWLISLITKSSPIIYCSIPLQRNLNKQWMVSFSTLSHKGSFSHEHTVFDLSSPTKSSFYPC